MRSLLILAALLPLPALAQDVDCATAETTVEMSYCASLDFDAADADLNQAYGAAMETAQGYDGDQEALLRDAQRAWIAFREAPARPRARSTRGAPRSR